MTTTPDLSTLLPDETTVRARRDALMQSVEPASAPTRTRRPERPRIRSRRVLVAVMALFVLSAGGAVAGGVFTAADVAIDDGIGCYETAALDANTTVMRPTADPVGACAALWRRGAVGETSGEAPQLVACSKPGGSVLVFPGDAGTCDRLGLKPLPRDYDAAVEAGGN